MYENISTHRVGGFDDHFMKPNVIDVPGPEFEKHPQGSSCEFDDWIQCIEYPIIFTLKSNKLYFYCSFCNHWYSMCCTFGNVKSHIKSKHLINKHKGREINLDQIDNINDSLNVEIPEDIDKLISSKFKSMILKTGRPFSLVQNPDMKNVLKFLGTRQNLTEKCDQIANEIKIKMKFILLSSSFISVAVDEWSDLTKRRFLGLTARCLHDGKIQTFFLSLTKIEAIHLNGRELNNIFNMALEKYSLNEKVMAAVSDNCNLMQNSFSYSNILRLPCACHLMNLLLKAFIRPSENLIQEITSACRCLKTSVCYTALKDDFNEPKLQSYTEIRWVSLYKSIKSIQKSRDSIETYYLVEEHNEKPVKFKFTQKHWDFMDRIIPVLKVYKQAVKILEGDSFGMISLVLSSFNKIKVTIENLPNKYFHENILSFKNEYTKIMNEYDDQIHPLYDAAALLNPFITKENIRINAGIKYIESHMLKLGWEAEQVKTSQNKTISFLSSQSQVNSSPALTKGPVHKLLELGVLIPDIGENESLGVALLKFWKERLDGKIDPELAKVAIGILNIYCTSCTAERFFSTAGRVVTRDRIKLMADVVESQTIIMANKELADKYCKFD